MSRIGKKEIKLPPGIHIIIENNNISIKGPKGELNYKYSDLIEIIQLDNIIKLKKIENTKTAQEIHGLSRSIINNMVIGVSQGFEKKLIIEGIGYRGQLEDKNLILNLGYSHPITIEPPMNIFINVENSTNISITGINKQTVGEIAAKIRSMRPPEPYKGKGIRYIDEIVRKKVGKAGK
uniref:Large ribosomal subunit protein uL6c n=1 Tax=Pleonosporium borreri TaxID=2575635 RepID=A0A4D6WWS8_9FLOR|nr:ribosomal protein L6 [Pleonosporium borreri]